MKLKKLLKNIFVYPLQKLFRGYPDNAWWSAFHFMSKRILPIMKQYRDNEKMGIPSYLITEMKNYLIKIGYEFDENIQSFSDKEINGKTADEICVEAWQKIIEEICFALEYCIDENDEDCYVENLNYNPKQKECMYTIPSEDGKFGTIQFNEDYGKTKLDIELYNKKNERVRKALEYMGKYWMCFWD